MSKKKQQEIDKHKVWKDKNIKFETKLIFKLLYVEQSERCDFSHMSIGKVQGTIRISNVGFKNNLKILEDNKYITFNEYDTGLYTYVIC